MSGRSSLHNFSQPTNLLLDLVDHTFNEEDEGKDNIDFGYFAKEDTWSEKYHNLLWKHNEFVKKVHSRLQKLQSKH